MENKKQKLEELKKRAEELKPITTKGFKTDKELDTYKQKNSKIFNEYYRVCEEIEQLKWELKSPEEKAQYLKEEEISKLKREGKL